MNSLLEQKLEAETLFIFYRKYSFMHWLINDNYSVKKCLIFPEFFKIKQIVHDLDWDFSLIMNKLNQIEPNLNGVFVNKYNKIRC